MFIEFIYTAYRFSVPVLLLLIIFFQKEKRIWLSNAIATSNMLLIIYSCCYLYEIIYLATVAYGREYEGYNFWYSRFDLLSPYWHLFYSMLLAVILPFLFLFKKLKANKWLVFIELFLLWWNDIWQFASRYFRDYMPSSWSVSYMEYNLTFKILNYLCLFIATYALLWLLKKLPSQQANK